jgi:hypothetical protein
LLELRRDERVGLGLELAVPLAEEAVAAEVAVLQALLQADVADAERRLDLDQLGGLASE